MIAEINEFRGENRFLSNFYLAEVEMDGEVYPSTEHAFQAAKTLVLAERQTIRQALTPSLAKKLGRTAVTLRSDWENVKIGVMESLVRQKFTRYPDLQERLLATGTANLVEMNWWNDQVWGVCRGKGKNYLGKILMKIQAELRGVS